MSQLVIRLNADELAALSRFQREHRSGALNLSEATRLLVRDELIRMGLLAMPAENRAKGARR